MSVAAGVVCWRSLGEVPVKDCGVLVCGDDDGVLGPSPSQRRSRDH